MVAGARTRLAPTRANGSTWAVIGLSLAFVALRLFLSRGMDAPFIFVDEYGYLLDARYLSGEGPTPKHPFVPFYSVGYPLVLAPLSWVFDHPTAVYHAALLGNALLGAVTIPILYALGRDVFGLDSKHALLAAGMAAAYPGVLLHTNIVWAENLLVPLIALHVWLVYRAVRSGSLTWLCALAVTAAALYATHQRTLPIVAVTAVLVGWMGLRRLARPAHAAAALAVLAFLGLCATALNGHVKDAVYHGPAGGSGDVTGSGDFVIRAIKDPSTYGEAIVRGLGQVWYLCATSAGLWALGVGFLAYTVWHRRKGSPPRARGDARVYTAGFMLAALLASFPPNALVIATKPSDSYYAFYGRYMEALSPVLLVAGVAAVLLLRGRRWRLIAAGAAAGATLLLAVIVRAGSPGLEQAPINPVMVLAAVFPAGVSNWNDLMGFDLWRATAIALAGMGLLAAVPGRRAGLAVAAVGVAFVGSSLVVADRVVQPFAVALTSERHLELTLDSLPAGEPVAYDVASFDPSTFPPYQYAIDDREFRLFDTREGGQPDANVVVAGVTEPRLRAQGARIAAFETTKDQAVWLRPGTLQRRLARRGWVFPGGITDPLPASARHALITVKNPVPVPIRVVRGRAFDLRLSVMHAGRGSPWPQPRLARPNGARGAVFVVGSWHRGSGRTNRISAHPVPLPRTLAPGGALEMSLTLTAVDSTGRSLRPGRYTVDLTPKQDAVFFSDAGDTPFELPVVVTAD